MFLYYFSIIFYFSSLSSVTLFLTTPLAPHYQPLTKNPPPIPQPPLTKKEKRITIERNLYIHIHIYIHHIHSPPPSTAEKEKKKKTSTIAATTSKPTSRPITLSPLFLSQLKLLLSLKIGL